jgi:hypothetical protein
MLGGHQHLFNLCLLEEGRGGVAPIQAPISQVVQEEKVQAFLDDTACFLIFPKRPSSSTSIQTCGNMDREHVTNPTPKERSESEVVKSILHNLSDLSNIKIDHVKSHQTGPNLSLAAVPTNCSDELAMLA